MDNARNIKKMKRKQEKAKKSTKKTTKPPLKKSTSNEGGRHKPFFK